MRPRATRLWGVVSLCVFLPIVFPFFSSAAWGQEELVESNPVQPRIVQPVDETKLAVLKGNTHRLARAQFDQGIASADLPMERMLLVLKRSPEQEIALRKLLDDQQDKASSNYHKWFTPEQFGKAFGPADQDIQTVTAWLQSHGFRIGHVAKGRNIIEFSGTASQVQEALHASIHKYSVNGEEHWANANDPQIPAALTPVVAGVHTLHNFLKKPMLHVSKDKIEAKLEGHPPHVTFPGNPPRHALGPDDYVTIYNIPRGLFGQGVIAVVGRSDLFTSPQTQQQGRDANDFNEVFGISGPGLHITLNGPDPGDLGGGEEAEATLDVTWSGAVAPGAFIDFVVSATTNTTDGIDLSEVYIIDNNLANVMTESFGGCEAARTNTEAQGVASLAEQAAAQGITYIVSAGDAGAEGCDDFETETVATGPVSVNVLAATPFTVAVGGTMFNENGQDSKYWRSTNNQGFESALSYIPESVWNESCDTSNCPAGFKANILAGSGGASVFFPKPTWQSGVTGIPKDNARDLPDVSLTAAGHDPYLLCLEGSCVPDSQGNISFAAVSGTSASAPSFAGIMALVNQTMSSRQGQADYVLYKLATTENLSQCNASSTSTLPASTCIFNDVTVGNNAVPGELNYGKSNVQYQSTVGYDLATGLGSLNVTNLLNKWSTVAFRPTNTTLTLNQTTIAHGQAVNVDVTVAPQSGTGTPTGEVSLRISAGTGLGTGVPLSAYILSGGALNASTNSLPGGTYQAYAYYAGDGTYAPSSSLGQQITVNQEPSTTVGTALGYPDQKGNFPAFTTGSYGTFVYLRADVKGQSGFGAATGNVNFMDGAASVPGNPYNLNSRGNTATPNGLFTFPAGTHFIIANYSGDSSFNSSASTAVDFTITPAATTTTVTATGVNLGASIITKSGGNPPTGTVTFFVDGAQAGSPIAVTGIAASINPQTDTLTRGSSATATLTVTKPPSKSLKAIYNGDTNYTTSTSSAVADFTLAASASTLTVASPGASGNLTLTVTAVDGLPGSIQFSAASCTGLPLESTCGFSPASLAGSGTATLTITTKAATAAMLRPEGVRPEYHQGPAWWMTFSGISLAGVVFLGLPSGRHRGKTLLSLIFVGFLTLSACGGGGGSSTSSPPPDPGTPAGSYPVVVTATSGALKHTVNITLTVE